MTVEEAMVSALAFERKVELLFRTSAEETEDPEASRFFRMMADEERGHVAYLEQALERWRSSGDVGPADVGCSVPGADWVKKGLEAVAAGGSAAVPGHGLTHLYSALEQERRVTEHYRSLADAMDHPDARALFRRFLEIEEGHTALVQAEIDYATHTGHFLGIQEFTLDG